MTLRRAAVLSVESGVVASYVHAAIVAGLGKIGVLVGLKSSGRQGEARRARPPGRHARRGGEPARRRREPHRPGRRSPASAPSSPSRRANPASLTASSRRWSRGGCGSSTRSRRCSKQAFVIDSERTVETVLKDAAKDVGGADRRSPSFVVFRLGEGVQTRYRGGLSFQPRLARKAQEFQGRRRDLSAPLSYAGDAVPFETAEGARIDHAPKAKAQAGAPQALGRGVAGGSSLSASTMRR